MLVGCFACKSLYNGAPSNLQQERTEIENKAAPITISVADVERTEGLDYDRARVGYEYVIVTFVVSYGGDDLYYMICPEDFYLIDEKGGCIGTAFSAVNNESRFFNAQLKPGEEFQGSVVFEVPIGEEFFEMKFRSTYNEGDYTNIILKD